MNLYFQITYFIQLLHSIEELSTGFHKKWYFFTMHFWLFLLFEICFSLFWGLVIFTDFIPYKRELSEFFLLLMFANGVQHVVWFGWTKKYVPGLITALAHIGWFVYVYFNLV